MIRDLLSEVGIRLRDQREGNHKTTCPRCSDTRKNKTEPCLSVMVTNEGRDTKAVWNCHHCGWSDWDGTGKFRRIKEAGQKVYRRPTLPAPSVLPEEQVPFHVEFLTSRGISRELIEAEGIYTTRVWMPQVQEKREVIAFPFRVDGVAVNAKYRDREKNFRQEKDAQPVPYGYDRVPPGTKTIVIVEGEGDRLSVMMAGIMEVWSVPDGAPTPAKDGRPRDYSNSPKFAWMDSVFDRIEEAERIIIAGDMDAPGMLLREELIRRVGRQKAWVVDWPSVETWTTGPDGEAVLTVTDCKDANAYLQATGPESLREIVLRGAKPVSVDGEVTVHDVWNSIETLYQGNRVEWFSCGYAGMDDVYRVLRRQLTVVTGWPHEGKSTFLDTVVARMAMEYGWRFAIYSAEVDAEMHVINLLEKLAGNPFFEGFESRLSLAEVRAYKAFLAEHFHFIRFDRKKARTERAKDGSRAPTRPDIHWIVDQADYMVRRYGVRGLLVDPLNRVARSRTGMPDPDHVIEVLDAVQGWAQDNNGHGWVVAHPMKLDRQKNGQRPRDLTLQDISGGANFDNMTDMGLSVRRLWKDPVTDAAYPADETPVVVECLKARSRFSGRKGFSGKFTYDVSTGTYEQTHYSKGQDLWIEVPPETKKAPEPF